LQKTLAAEFPLTPLRAVSAIDGNGVDGWLDEVLHQQPGSRRVVDVDYDVYAAGEAALGWLNAVVSLRADRETDWAAFCLAVLENVQMALAARRAEVGHVKLYLSTATGSLTGNLTGGAEPSVAGALRVPSSESPRDANLLVNARAQTDPTTLQQIVETSLASAAGTGIVIKTENIQCFSPARPQPTYRMMR
jgi:hypothetical protein